MTKLMRLFFHLPALTLTVILFSGCKGQKKETKADRLAQELYFQEEALGSLDDLTNEMAEAPTDFLRLFKDDPIPWQAWNKTVPSKAKSCQMPILAFVVSSRDGGCRDTIKRLFSDQETLSLIREKNVCTLIDIHANPEIGLLSYHLASEIRQPVGFPMAIWLSHEAAPLGWMPLPDLSNENLKSVIGNSAAMVGNIWTESSDYAVRNSRRDSKARQQRIDAAYAGSEEEIKRANLFQRQARQITSLYDPISKNLDGSGGLVPASALELLVQTHLSPFHSEKTKKNAQKAIEGIISSIQQGAIHDPLDDFYFYARRSQDWSLPAFSKDLETQAQFGTALVRSGQAIKDEEIISAGIDVITNLRDRWLPKNYTNESSLLEKKIPGVFLWDWITLKKTLTDEELRIAQAAFALKKEGNIPALSDPTSQFFELNSLRHPFDLAPIANALSMSVAELKPQLDSVTSKLQQHREETGAIFRETQVSAQARAQFCLGQIAKWSATGSSIDLAEAVVTGNIIRNEHRPEGQLMRFPSSFKLKARGADYSRSILAGVRLYQATLDPEWLEWSSDLAHEAINLLIRDDNNLILEISQEDRIIPIDLHSDSMIFSESTLGILDLALSRICSLMKDEKLDSLRNTLGKALAASSERVPIIHTDFISSCALGNIPLVAVLSGDFTSPAYQNLIRTLNSPEFISFIAIRSDTEESELKPLPSFKRPTGAGSITLVRGEKIIGQATSPNELRLLIRQALSQKE
ncbi:DUF255 domain-containing protein [Akkermansiaceae bacterium]|nr:DUF255 domain-containing protein [Akkermansiaceae bacterium]